MANVYRFVEGQPVTWRYSARGGYCLDFPVKARFVSYRPKGKARIEVFLTSGATVLRTVNADRLTPREEK